MDCLKNRVSIDSFDSGEVQVRIAPDKHNLFIKLILLIVSFLCTVFPIALLFVKQASIGFGFIITIIIFWGTAIYFFRKYLWNYHGAEVFIITQTQVRHYYDYKYFKDNQESNSFDDLKPIFSKPDDPDNMFHVSQKELNGDTECHLGFVINDHPVRSHLLVSFRYVVQIVKLLKEKNVI